MNCSEPFGSDPFDEGGLKKDYKVVEIIGRGAFGTVYKCLRLIDGIHIAIKVFRKYDESKRNNNSFLRQEYELLSRLQGPNIVRLLSYHENHTFIYLFLEYCEGGDLLQTLQRHQLATGRAFDERQAGVIIRGVLKGLYLLHYNHKVIHRDIKPGNILIRRKELELTEDDVCIADFGLSVSLMNSHTTRATVICGTQIYQAPEILKKEPYDTVVLYSLRVSTCSRSPSLHLSC